MRLSIPLAGTVIACASLIAAPAAAQASRTASRPAHAAFHAVLRGADEIPPVASRADGSAQFTLVGSRLLYRVNVDDLRDVTGVFLHIGHPGQSRPVVAALYEGMRPGLLSGVLATGALRPTDVRGTSMDNLVRALRHNDVYLSVHTREHPSGELRGELVMRTATVGG